MIEEDDKHRFITCPIAKAIWVVLSQIWAPLTCTSSPLNGFSLMVSSTHPNVTSGVQLSWVLRDLI